VRWALLPDNGALNFQSHVGKAMTASFRAAAVLGAGVEDTLCLVQAIEGREI
jgi:hypothetical protein